MDDAREVTTPLPTRVRLLMAQTPRHLRPAVSSLVVLTLLTGIVFPLLVLGLGGALFPGQAAGSLVTRRGVIVGSTLIGQGFARSRDFQSRPSAAGASYDATQSGGSNFAPSNPKLVALVAAGAAAVRNRESLAADTPIPIDAVTRSASGLDPDISPQNAALQIPRVAHARGLRESIVRDLVARQTRGPDLYLLGAPRVSVLALNLALDRVASEPGR